MLQNWNAGGKVRERRLSDGKRKTLVISELIMMPTSKKFNHKVDPSVKSGCSELRLKNDSKKEY